MTKAVPAILFAVATTALVGIAILLIGANALFNPNTVPVVSAATAPTTASVDAAVGQTAQSQNMDQQKLAQMSQLLQQYQDREKQYQQRLDEAAKRLNDANQQIRQANQTIEQSNQSIQTYQQILVELQRRGLIRIDNNGQIFLQRGSGD
jgi:septal ring factor EnvC (AmiA/AmiB activator)